MRTLCLVPLFLLFGCATVPDGGRETSSAADGVFRRLSADYISGYLDWRPQTGTALGLHEYDGKLTDYSRPSLQSELARLKTFEQRLANLQTDQLGTRASYDYRLLRASIQREIFGFEQIQSFTRNPMAYAGALDVNIYIKRNFAPLENRVRSIIVILGQAPRLFAAARANLAESLPRPFIETAIEQAGGLADFLNKDLVEALRNFRNENLMAEFDSTNRCAIAELRDFVTWLKTEKLPKATEDYALGRDKYVQMLEYGELVDISPERILEIGMRELHEKQRVFAEAAAIVDPAKKPIEVFQQIQHDHPTAKNLIPDTARDLENIRQFLVDHQILTLPSRVRAQVAETPQYMRATSFASMDSPGVFEKRATEAYYYVTPPEPDWTPRQTEEWLTAFNYYTTDIVSTHEAYPGHYVQFLCLQASPANRLEKIFTSYAFTEGWAHYAEQMMVDEGFGAPGASGNDAQGRIRAAKYRLAQTDEALLRLCRLCVSVKMHCQGMTIDEATKFFQDNCYYEAKPARQEAIRGAYDPEYLYYTLGKLEILKLRDDYRKQEGANFSLRKFHDELLRHGAPPIRLLRECLLKDPASWPNVL
ncbi:MAG TPA: DUF885 domain-containing protein [Verrucomicrobiae bacterium]